jgi:hypothetical protein
MDVNVADEPASPVGSPSDIPGSPKLISMRSSAFFTNLDSSTTPTPTWIQNSHFEKTQEFYVLVNRLISQGKIILI